MKTQWVSIAVLLSFAAVAYGQTSGEVTGQVRDQTGSSVAGANVTVTNVATNASRSSVTNEAGIYSFPSLPPGAYNVRVERAGFKIGL
jgi:protocatechuate 3,4-dioxygenase beta subunit